MRAKFLQAGTSPYNIISAISLEGGFLSLHRASRGSIPGRLAFGTCSSILTGRLASSSRSRTGKAKAPP
ncbi:hypothetical protein BDY21DRAFT_347052 [Lineolata rhizophorae]|uniref:Uncharacterized protein n=1 Tax=Lineolata rhizophorae TaxID=578093 RepID=A0A6A6NXX5_9PEZI|nr:hypothetical protein BDY21DRAFT_347052 [Lineolata rhizophorae]